MFITCVASRCLLKNQSLIIHVRHISIKKISVIVTHVFMLHYSDFIFILNRNNVWIYKYVVLQNQVDSFYGNIFVYNFVIEENLGIFP